MKQNKFAYLFAVTLAAGTVGMTSCSSEVNDIVDQGVENKVTLSLSVADRVAGRATASDVNLGTTMQTIKNIAVVPMISNTNKSVYLSPIILGDFTPQDQNKTTEKVAALNSNVNKFKVYGNIDKVDNGVAAFDESKVFSDFTISAKEYSQDEAKPTLEGATFYKPHGLYYYAFAGDGQNKIKTGSSSESLNEVEIGTVIGKDAKYIKLGGVNYAVGVLATAVFNTSDKKFITNSSSSSEAVSSTNVKFKGIIINKQSKTLNQDFVQSGTDLVSIYDASLNSVSGEKGFDGSNFQSDNKSRQQFTNISSQNSNQDKANIYTIVTATGSSSSTQITDKEQVKKVIGEIVTGNLEFELQKGYKLTLSNGSTIDASSAAKKFYMAFRLQPEIKESVDSYSYKAVFIKDHMTFFNAKVKNWGLASENPIEVTDATIGVEVDLQWSDGIVYDEEI